MPRAPSICSTPGCPLPAPCPTHPARGRDTRPPASARGYDHRWAERSRAFLADHTQCCRCPAPSAEADHIIPRWVLVLVGAIDPDDASHLQPLCKSCHSKKTRIEDRRWRDVDDPLELLADTHDDA